MDRAVLFAAIAEYVETSQKVIAFLLEQKGDIAGHDFHGNRWTGGLGSAGALASRVAVQRHLDYMGEQDHATHALDLMKRTGGFTYDPAEHRFTNVGDHGFAVSPYKGREAVFTSPITRADLEDYIRKNADVLGLPGHAVGGWDDENGKQILDVSIIAPTKDEALVLAHANDQDAIFDFAAGQSIAAKAAEEKGDASGHAFHGNRWTGGIGGSGNLPFNAHGDQYFHALSPKGQAFVKASCAKFGVTPDAIANEVKTRLSLPDGSPNKALLDDGAKWYPMAHELADRIAVSTLGMAHPVSMEQVAASMAKLSPQTPWETNAEVASRLAQWTASGRGDGMTSDKAALAFKAEWHANGWGGESITHPGTMNKLAMMNNLVSSALDVLNGTKTIEESLTSPKQRSFANNIMLPHETGDVTVDIMMQKSISYVSGLPKDPDAADESGQPRDKTVLNFFSAKSVEAAAGPGYVTVAAGTRIAAEALGYAPDAVQAAYWIAVQDQTPPNWPRSTGATMTQMKMPNVEALLGHAFIGTAGYAGKAAHSEGAPGWPLTVDYGTMPLDDTETMSEEEYEAAVGEKDAPSGQVKGDTAGHAFHGNRWTGGIGGDHSIANGDLRSHLLQDHERHLRNSKERNVARIGTAKEQDALHETAHARAAKEPPPPIKVSTIDEAVKLLGEGKGIMFERPDQAVTLLHELSRIAQEAKAAGTKAPTYDLCKVSVSGTNLFCAENVGIPRSAMPQLIGKPIPGSPADSLPKSAKGEVDLGPAFRDYLTAQGNLIIDTDEFASHLRASQTEMDGTKVGGMMESMQAGTMPPGRIFISDDNYVIDGHHRWAATVGEGLGEKKEMSISVARINMKILPALAAANSFAETMGIPQSPVTKAFFGSLDLKLFEAPGQKELGQPGRVAWFGDDHSTSELSATIDTKELSDADKADLARENEKIRGNVATLGAVPHTFKPAQWTHPNGHPRCELCGGEERVGGACLGDMVATDEGARSPSRPKS